MTDEPVAVDEMVDEPEAVDVLDPQVTDDVPTSVDELATLDVDQVVRTDEGDPA